MAFGCILEFIPNMYHPFPDMYRSKTFLPLSNPDSPYLLDESTIWKLYQSDMKLQHSAMCMQIVLEKIFNADDIQSLLQVATNESEIDTRLQRTLKNMAPKSQLSALQRDHERQIDTLKQEHQRSIDNLKQEHERQIDKLKQEHKRNLQATEHKLSRQGQVQHREQQLQIQSLRKKSLNSKAAWQKLESQLKGEAKQAKTEIARLQQQVKSIRKSKPSKPKPKSKKKPESEFKLFIKISDLERTIIEKDKEIQKVTKTSDMLRQEIIKMAEVQLAQVDQIADLEGQTETYKGKCDCLNHMLNKLLAQVKTSIDTGQALTLVRDECDVFTLSLSKPK